MVGFQVVVFHGFKAFRDDLLQVFVDVCFWVVTHEICCSAEIDDGFIVFDNYLCLSIISHSFYALHIAVQLTAHNDTVSIGENLCFFRTGEIYF